MAMGNKRPCRITGMAVRYRDRDGWWCIVGQTRVNTLIGAYGQASHASNTSHRAQFPERQTETTVRASRGRLKQPP